MPEQKLIDSVSGPLPQDRRPCGEIAAQLGEEFDHLTALASNMLQAPTSLVSLLDPEEEGQIGCCPLDLDRGQTAGDQPPLSHSYCQYVSNRNLPLVVADTRTAPRLRSLGAPPQEIDVIAYLGVPIHRANGLPIGALCTIDRAPHAWTLGDVAMLTKLAKCVSDQIRLRGALVAAEARRRTLDRDYQRLRRYNAQIESVAAAFITPDLTIAERCRAVLRCGCRDLGMELGTINRIDGGRHSVVFATGPQHEALEGQRQPVGQTLCSLAIQGQRQIAVPDVAARLGQGWRDGANHGVGSYLGAPIIYNGVLFGTISFTARGPRPEWSEDQISLMTVIALTVSTNLALRAEAFRLHQSRLATLGFFTERAAGARGTHPALDG